MAGFAGKEFDVPWYFTFDVYKEIMFAKPRKILLYRNQDSILGQSQRPTDCWVYSYISSCCLPAMQMHIKILQNECMNLFKWCIIYLAKVWNTKPGGIVVCAPPCSTWVFLSTSVTNRSWSQPEGNGCTCVRIANLMIRRLLYMFLVSNGWIVWDVP